MKKLIFFLFGWILFGSLQAQQPGAIEFRTTYPIDSCLYLMDPFNLRVNLIQTLTNGNMGVKTSFRNSAGSSTQFMIQGKGRFIVNPDLLPPGTDLSSGTEIKAVISLPDFIHDLGDESSGGSIPFPVLLNGFLQEIAGTLIDPPLAFAMQTTELEVISLLD